MADQPVVHIGENSPEKIALTLMKTILHSIEKRSSEDLDRKTYLDTYAECLAAVTSPNRRLKLP